MAFVVMHHLAVTYSAFGSWYYIEPPHLDTLSTVWFAFYLSFQQAYFLGLLFLLSGYFVAGSYDRKGFGRLVRGRKGMLLDFQKTAIRKIEGRHYASAVVFPSFDEKIGNRSYLAAWNARYPRNQERYAEEARDYCT